jgi:CoA:oxalate CoA-transferase
LLAFGVRLRSLAGRWDNASFNRGETLMPLTGVKVLDLTRVLSGPFCTALLGDMGAEVIKVEAPEGDSVRGQGAIKDGLSWYFAQFNRNKRSLRLDLRKPEAKAILVRLIERSDVLVENFRPGVLGRLGFPPAKLQELRPSLVTCSINGFGSTGPYQDRPAFDFIAQAMSGFMSVNGDSDDPPLRSGLPISDLVAGLYAALSIAAAVPHARATGQGQRAEVSLTNGLISLLSYIASNYFATGAVLERSGNDHPIAAPYGLFATRDGQIALAPADDAFFRRLADALGEPGLKTDPLYATQAVRVANRARINAIVGGKLAANTTAYWVEVLNKAGVPSGPVNSVAEVFRDPQVMGQDMVLEVDHPGYGMVRMLGFPIKFSGLPCRVRRPAPGLGEHSDEILTELGYAAAARQALREDGVI